MSMNIRATELSVTGKGVFSKAQVSGVSVPMKASEKKSSENNISAKEAFRPEASATARISDKGREKLQDMREKERALDADEKQTRENMKRVDGLISKVNKGGTLSDEEKAFVNDEIQTLASQNYVEKRTHFFTDDELKEAMGKLQKNYLRRLDMYRSMQEQVQSQGEANDLARTDRAVQNAKDVQEKGKRIMDILKKSLKTPEEDDLKAEAVAGKEKTSDSEDSSGQTVSAQNAVEETDDTVPTTTADKKAEEDGAGLDHEASKGDGIIEKNLRLLNNMDGFVDAQARYTKQCDSLMDDAFLDVSNTLSSDEAGAEEKLKAYGSYQEEMQHIYADKLTATAQVRFDSSTRTIGRIEMNAHDDLAEVIRDFVNNNGKKGINMAKGFLTDNE
ncbi:hypothetical protein [Dialister sp.]|uniref:hypothetical protein n=1 Tax=Dialister sp. TaxID=1955814 RepID=UPI002E8202A6|nr:hypothetical protein [Dialister sp.]MEE3453617.1 hypothetical protein [Dialister sp.]